MGSPVIMLSSTEEEPSMMMPSTGIFAPGFTRKISPTFTSLKLTVFSTPSTITWASEGERFISFRMASPVFLWAFASNNCPSKTSVMITHTLSK